MLVHNIRLHSCTYKLKLQRQQKQNSTTIPTTDSLPSPLSPLPPPVVVNFCGQLPQMGSLPLAVNVWMACRVTAEEFVSVTAESELFRDTFLVGKTW